MEKDILYSAIENFSINSKFNLEVNKLFAHHQDNGYDGKLRLSSNRNRFDFLFEVKKKLTLSKLPHIHKYSNNNDIILISDYIPKSLKAYLKDENVSYLDAAGNAFITNNEGLFIYIETKKASSVSSGISNRAFSKSGLKVIYQILINEETLNMSYRHIGKVSKVSIDTVGKVFKELLRDKYLIQIKKKKFEVENKERLFQEWVTVFNKVLRPKLKQRNFKPKNMKIIDLYGVSSPNSVGGELAAELLSNYLIAERAVIYTEQPFIDVALNMELIPVKNGPVTLMEKFWTDEFIYDDTVTVHPILVYADLLNNPTPRNLETAKIIYDKHVKNTL